MPRSHIRVPRLEFQFLVDVHPGRQWIRSQVVGSLTSAWDTWTEFWVQASGWPNSSYCEHLASEWAHGISLFPSSSFYLSLCLPPSLHLARIKSQNYSPMDNWGLLFWKITSNADIICSHFIRDSKVKWKDKLGAWQSQVWMLAPLFTNARQYGNANPKSEITFM